MWGRKGLLLFILLVPPQAFFIIPPSFPSNHIKPPPIFPKPPPVLLIIRAKALHQPPEGSRMIHEPEMAKLMDDHIVADRLRSHDQAPIKIKVPPAAAASPAAFLILDVDFFKIYF